MKKFVVLLLAIGCFALIANFITPVTANQATSDHVPFKFKYLIGDIVEYDNDWWEVVGRQERRSDIDGNIYPWYLLVRPMDGKVESRWVWAGYVDGGDVGTLGDGGGGDDCCGTPPPPCENPPC
jgi:hypothetical protein